MLGWAEDRYVKEQETKNNKKFIEVSGNTAIAINNASMLTIFSGKDEDLLESFLKTSVGKAFGALVNKFVEKILPDHIDVSMPAEGEKAAALTKYTVANAAYDLNLWNAEGENSKSGKKTL